MNFQRDFSFTPNLFCSQVLMVAIENWALPTPAMPPPAAGHDFPGKLN
jgi:hypothetical protein